MKRNEPQYSSEFLKSMSNAMVNWTGDIQLDGDTHRQRYTYIEIHIDRDTHRQRYT